MYLRQYLTGLTHNVYESFHSLDCLFEDSCLPKLSIITVNLNNVIGLQKTMESVFAQTFHNYEYIIIDGDSTDGSKELIKKHENKLAYWVSEEDEGIYHAMNKGIVKATGEYLIFVNSGDYFSNDFVCEKMLDDENLKADIVYGNLERVYPDGHKDVRYVPSSWSIEYLIKTAPDHNAVFIKKRLFDEYGLYDQNLKIVSDWAFFFKVVVTGNATCFYKNINVVTFSWGGISNQPQGLQLLKSEREKVIKEKLPPSVAQLLENYHSVLARNQELEGMIVRKKQLLNQLLKLINVGFKRRLVRIQNLFSQSESR